MQQDAAIGAIWVKHAHIFFLQSPYVSCTVLHCGRPDPVVLVVDVVLLLHPVPPVV